jgi:hypothetical protein
MAAQCGIGLIFLVVVAGLVVGSLLGELLGGLLPAGRIVLDAITLRRL